jgi:hypothetical protein
MLGILKGSCRGIWIAVVSSVLTARGLAQASGVFPGEPFNGMQISYSISGANVTKTTDTPGFTWQRLIQGSLGSGELRVTGKANLDNGLGYRLRITVQVGSKTKTMDLDKKVKQEGSFDVSLPIGNTDASGSVTIAMTGIYNGTTRGVNISAVLSQMAPIIKDTKPNPGNLSSNARLKMILDRFMTEIPPGNFGSGWMNNVASVIPFTSRFDSSICGNYQAKVLALLDSIRWSTDPKIKSLMDGFDYGPIQSLYGGHQAVVIYPKGKEWMTDGIVLDPWIEQKPKSYAAQDWAQMYSFGAGSHYGIGGSSVYEGTPAYPTVGGAYKNPKAKDLTEAEKTWIRSLPQIDKDRLKKITDPNLQNMVIKSGFANKKLTGIMVVNCPVNVSVVNSAGKVVGFTDAGFVAQTRGATLDRVTRGPGDWLTIVRFDPSEGFKARLQATGGGPVEMSVGYGMDQDARTASRYSVPVRRGDGLDLGIAKPGAILSSDRGVSIAPTLLSGSSSVSNSELKPVFDNNNIGAVLNGPTKVLWLTFDRDVVITQIQTYHWNSGRGTQGGSISLVEKSSGKVVGTWLAVGSPGMNGVPNATWTVTPNLLIRKGVYSVSVTAPETWSYNSQSGGAGFVRIWARPTP